MSAKRFKGGQGLSASKLNQVVDSVNASEKVGLYGMTGQVSPAGRMLVPIDALGNPVAVARAKDGTREDLQFTQGTSISGSVSGGVDSDSWCVTGGGTYTPVSGAASGSVGVELSVLSDWWHNPADLKFYGRTRTIKIDKKGLVYSITGESAPIELTALVKKCSICAVVT